MLRVATILALFLTWTLDVLAAGLGNRLAYLDDPCDPYYVGLEAPKFVTPQWVGDDEVELVVVLSIDDLRDSAVFEKYLGPVFERLQKIDGRTPISMMTNRFDPNDPRLAAWFKTGVNLGAHTKDHPCPCLQGRRFDKAKATYDTCVDELKTLLPEARTVGFRMPCCDSMNSVSPRFFAEIFGKTTPRGNFLEVDSSVFVVLTPNDPALPRALVMDPDQRPRLGKYSPANKKWVNYVEDYPYPYIIGRLCWEIPATVPGDWQGINLHKPCNPQTVRDMQAAIDATAVKQGVYTLCFHPHYWLANQQVVEIIDHAVAHHGRKVKFLQFAEVLERITRNALGGQPVRAANGQDNGVRVLDLDRDGYMDVVVGNERARQTRLWSPRKRQWIVSDFPVELVVVDSSGNRLDAGVRFGVLQRNGMASMLVRNERVAGLWHFDGAQWKADPQGLAGLEADGPVATSLAGRDRGVRLVDLDADGICELVVGNERQQAVFAWSPDRHAWHRLPFGLPPGTAIVDAQGRDAGARWVDLDGDGRPDFVFSGPDRFALYLGASRQGGWSRKVLAGKQGEPGALFPLVRADGTNNGAWFKNGQIWLQNEETGGVELPSQAASRSYAELLSKSPDSPAR